MNIQPSTQDLDFCSGLLCIELDSQSPNFTDKAPALLSEEAAERLAKQMVDDLNHLLDEGIAPAGLVMVGALYDQTDIFRPGFPLLTALADQMRRAPRHDGLPPPKLALGTQAGRFPINGLDPRTQPILNPLVLLPFCLVGPSQVMDRLHIDMETTLARIGEAFPATHAAVENLFQVPVLNLFYTTLSDMCVWLRNQMKDNGLQGLWALLELSLFERPGPHQIVLAGSHNRYVLADDEAWTPFYTFDRWARFGPGRAVAAEQLEIVYQDWLRQFRLYAVALPGYGLPLHIVLGAPSVECSDTLAALTAVRAAPALNDDYVVETAYLQSGNSQPVKLLATRHSSDELSVIACSVASVGSDGQLLSLEHFYPLAATGLEAILDLIRQRSEQYGLPCTMRQPGGLIHSPADRRLGVLDEQNRVLVAPPT